MSEVAFLGAIQGFVEGASGLPVTPSLVGPAEPTASDQLPAVVLSLEQSERLDTGLGGGAALVTGALAVATVLDLSSPLLPGHDLSLVSEDRRELTLVHGGLVRADGTEGALSAADLTVTLTSPTDVETTLAVVAGEPQAGQVRATPEAGLLRFGEPLPPEGTIKASYFIGRWERISVRLRGILRMDVCAADASAAADLSSALTRGLTSAEAKEAIDGLTRLAPAFLGSVGPIETALANSRRRIARFSFEYERRLDKPASSGGVIGRIPVDTELTALVVDDETGAVSEETVTESG